MVKLHEKFSWVLADSTTLDPTQDIDDFKRIGPIWGSWRIWRSCQNDNVICHDQIKAVELLKRQFQTRCNFYIPDSVYVGLERPEGVKVYAGEFVHDVIQQEEIVALHLAASTSDIVLLYGWNFEELDLENESDRLKANQLTHHRNMVRSALATYNQITWVIVDHTGSIDPKIANLENVVTDTLSTVLEL
jgi:hypothetical protein